MIKIKCLSPTYAFFVALLKQNIILYCYPTFQKFGFIMWLIDYQLWINNIIKPKLVFKFHEKVYAYLIMKNMKSRETAPTTFSFYTFVNVFTSLILYKKIIYIYIQPSERFVISEIFVNYVNLVYLGETFC